MIPPPRADLMARRLTAAARRAGFGSAALARLEAAFRLAMQPRASRLPDEHHPDYLHPARTALILLEDLAIADPDLAVAAAVCETLRDELTTPLAAIQEVCGPDVAHLVQSVPRPASAGDELLEQLVTAPEPARVLALAERLDHARHLHLRPRADWQPLHHSTCTVYLPVAERTHPGLARRYRWWCRTFHRRYLF
ncbi:MAG: HD domain-containing protein [Gemmatimonadetes bacterium]|nr:HD domain-containing protein [Gemmatimonadota bacterium]